MVDQFLSNQKRSTVEGPCIQDSEVGHILRKLKPRTAPGHDGITNILLRNLPSTGITYLTALLSSSLQLGHFPNSWKHAKVLAIVKPRRPPTAPRILQTDYFTTCYWKCTGTNSGEAVESTCLGYRNHTK